jgi:hypothetical protein
MFLTFFTADWISMSLIALNILTETAMRKRAAWQGLKGSLPVGKQPS